MSCELTREWRVPWARVFKRREPKTLLFGKAKNQTLSLFGLNQHLLAPQFNRIMCILSPSHNTTTIFMFADDDDAKKQPTNMLFPGNEFLDTMLRHESFPEMLELALQILMGRQQVHEATGEYYASSQDVPKSHVSLDDTLVSVKRVYEIWRQHPELHKTVMRREFPVRDAILDDCIKVLRTEQRNIRDALHGPPKKGYKKRKGGSEPIAVKYAKWQTDILMAWMIEHRANPFPDASDLQQLIHRTGLTHSQVVNWTTNVRKRNRKATLGGKKPHHFIDFVFLVQERENRKRMANDESYVPNLAPIPEPVVSAVAAPAVSSSDDDDDDSFKGDPLPFDSTNDALMQDFAKCWMEAEDYIQPTVSVDDDDESRHPKRVKLLSDFDLGFLDQALQKDEQDTTNVGEWVQSMMKSADSQVGVQMV